MQSATLTHLLRMWQHSQTPLKRRLASRVILSLQQRSPLYVNPPLKYGTRHLAGVSQGCCQSGGARTFTQKQQHTGMIQYAFFRDA
jgi:hypothetical protein